MKLMTTYRHLNLLAIVLAFSVIVMGAYTRLNYAGLACPDWPGCFGEVWVPDTKEAQDAAAKKFAQEVEPEKAALEMIHRYLASLLGLFIMVMLFLSILARALGEKGALGMSILLFIVVCFQGALGMWTVTEGVSPPIVTAHLIGGMTVLGLLTWQYFGKTDDLVMLGLASLLVVGMQITLGGWTSTNYAVTCNSEFPTCDGSYWPEDANFVEAFSIWKPLGPNYELTQNRMSHNEQNAIQLVHRAGAVLTLFVVGMFGLFTLLSRERLCGGIVLGLLAAQITLGILTAMTVGKTTLIATAHNGGAALLLLAVIMTIARVSQRHNRD